jgi:transcriptional regulator of arginine metabolism
MRIFIQETVAMPGAASQQTARREAILDILAKQRVARQEDLVHALHQRGFEATQSSISRDLKDLGVAKVGERYLAPQSVRAAELRPFELLASFVRTIATAGPNLTIIRTATGAAQSVAVALDESGWPEVAGTISGDDTIFIATGTLRQQQLLVARLEQVFPAARR